MAEIIGLRMEDDGAAGHRVGATGHRQLRYNEVEGGASVGRDRNVAEIAGVRVREPITEHVPVRDPRGVVVAAGGRTGLVACAELVDVEPVLSGRVGARAARPVAADAVPATQPNPSITMSQCQRCITASCVA